MTEVHHARRTPLFVTTEEGARLRLAPEDLTIIGFKNRLRWDLLQKGWTETALTSQGLDLISMQGPQGQKVILAKNVYGDEMRELLDFLYQKGSRQLVYLGTAGGLGSEINVGDVLLPSEVDVDGKIVKLSNKTELLGNVGLKDVTVRKNVRHGWVQYILKETREFLTTTKASGTQSLDIETRYLAEFLNLHPEMTAAAALIVSDLPLGKVTYDQHLSHMDKVDLSLQQILPEILNIKQSHPACSQVYY